MKRLYGKLEKFARKLEKEGKIESAIEIYERLGKVREEYLQNALNSAYKNGLYSLGIKLCNKHFGGRGHDFFRSKVIGIGKNGKFLSMKLSEELKNKKDPDNQRYDQGLNKIYYKN